MISIAGAVSANGLERLRRTIPKLTHLTQIHLHNFDPPTEWYDSLVNIRSLSIWAEGSWLRRARLSVDQMKAIANLPNLQLLFVFGYAEVDNVVHPLGGSASLRHLFFRRTWVTVTGKEMLESALPECVVHVD